MSPSSSAQLAPKLIILSAPSGAGKTTLCQRLLQEFSGRLLPSVSCTTRQPRKGEIAGVHYHYISEEEFKSKIEKKDFAEWARVHNHLYGTSKSAINTIFSKGQSVLLEIDVQGAESLRSTYPGQYFSIFISPPSMEELERRLRARGTDSEETIQRRLNNARHEISRSSEFDLIIINDDFEKAYSTLKAHISKQVGSNV